ncbi:MAG: diguanylate cyclase [Rhizobiales bacterium]|nr:diguanylate cyclase [Hyphomicrobiales bacterium]
MPAIRQSLRKSGARSGTMHALIAIGAVVTIGISLIGWMSLSEIARRDRAQAEMAARNLITSLGSDISRNIELFDLSLQAVAEGLQNPEVQGVSAELRQLVLFDRSTTAKNIGSLLVLDPDGNVVVESRSLTPRDTNYARRPYFQFHREHPKAGLHISAPYATKRGEYVLAISRRIDAEDGVFGGVVVGMLKLSYFHDLFRHVTVGDGDALMLMNTDGIALMRSPFNASLVGVDISQTTVTQAMLSEPAGVFEAQAGIDGIQRFYVHQTVPGLPLKISYGTAINRIYAGWRQEAWRIGALVASLCCINLALLIGLTRSLRRRDEAEEQLQRLATTDALTGLYNRRHFDQTIAREWNRARRVSVPVSVLMIDADHFKAFNDTFGHQMGDDVLAALGDCIASVTQRSSDCSARYGGEEFAVILPGVGADETLCVAEAIRSKIGALRELQQGRPDRLPTVSIGAATLVPQAGLTPRDLIKAADAALYAAKEAGRDRVMVAAIPRDLPREKPVEKLAA